MALSPTSNPPLVDPFLGTQGSDGVRLDGTEAQRTEAPVGGGSTIPGPPTNVVASEVGATMVSVAFTAPVNLGGGVTSYVVTSDPGNLTASAASSPIAVGGGYQFLAEYRFFVKATNAAGASVDSAPSNLVQPYWE